MLKLLFLRSTLVGFSSFFGFITSAIIMGLLLLLVFYALSFVDYEPVARKKIVKVAKILAISSVPFFILGFICDISQAYLLINIDPKIAKYYMLGEDYIKAKSAFVIGDKLETTNISELLKELTNNMDSSEKSCQNLDPAKKATNQILENFASEVNRNNPKTNDNK